jgi:hypothetical protein
LGQYGKNQSNTDIFRIGPILIGLMIPLLINQSNISRDFSLQLSKRLTESDQNWTNAENIRIGLVFAVLAQ